MGLDMYLTKRTYIKNWNYMEPEERHIVTIQGPESSHIDTARIREIVEDVGYWRKANHIHRWFVENVQKGKDDCGEYPVSIEQLKDLQNKCLLVLETPELAPKILPTADGFFFGGTEYDEWYFESLRDTVEILNVALSHDEGGYYYESSW